MPNPFKLLVRLIVVSGVVLWLAHHYRHAIMESLLPIIKTTIATVQNDFTIQSLDIAEDGPNETLRLRANLAQPVEIGGRMFYPVGYGTQQTGGYQITMTVGGAMLYSLLTLIVVLAWPVTDWKMLLKRVVIALPLMMGLLLINVATTFPAELWTPIHKEWVPDVTWPLLVWSKILMGGGGLVLGLLSGGIAVALSAGTVKPSLRIEAQTQAV